MENISRRDFVKNASAAATGVAVLSHAQFGSLPSGFGERNISGVAVFVPMPIQVIIDDVGWWSGADGSKKQEPYRTGINRNHVPADYLAIVELGRALGIRPQAATVLCEWDKQNILRELPTSTWMGDQWDNSKWVGPWLEEAAEIIRGNQDHYEITIHGIGHEYWEGGTFTRAEWTDSYGQMRPRDQIEKHLDYFEKLMNQHDLGQFPKSFVPAAFRHSFGPSTGQDVSLAELLKNRGVNYINSPTKSMYHADRMQYGIFGFDHGVMTIDRGADEFPWNTFPADPSKELTGPTCGMHWPHLLHPSPERNSEIVRRWVTYLKAYNEKADTMLAQDSVAFQHQLVHHLMTKAVIENNAIELDFTKTDDLPGGVGNYGFYLKVKSKDSSLKFISKGVNIISQVPHEGSDIIHILRLEREPGKSGARISFG